ncbi:MAG: tetratricopeptide repeat protein [Elusimicrobia bacterium]|nr:tetratricopeptide repeat protein [Elusimicrobiota bacterium]
MVPAALADPAGGAGSRQAQREYLRATLLERRGAPVEALEAYEKALALDSGSAFLAGEAAELALELGDRGRAEALARRRLALAPGDPRSALLLGRVLWAGGDAAGAQAQFERALKGSASADILLPIVELVAGRDPARARALLERFLAGRPPEAARALYALGRLNAQAERFPEAVAALKEAIILDASDSGPARLTLAQVYEVLGDTRAAIAEYQRLLAVEPGDPELWARVGALQALAGDQGAAAETFRALKVRHPDDPAACAWLAAEAERAGDFAAAALALQDSAALRDDATLNLRLSYYQLQAGDAKAAMAALAEARRRWPRDDRVAYYLALGLDDQGRRREAAALLREVLALKPGDRDARWQLAAILERLGRMDEAEAEFRALLADKPDDAPALNYLGYALADRGLKLGEAEALIRRALALEPSNAAYRDSLGWALFKTGRSTEAVRELAASARAAPDDGEVWEHLGAALRVQGRRRHAWRAWRLAQSLGAEKAGPWADALGRDFSADELGELWRAHLSAAHGGVRRLAGVCALSGRVAGRGLDWKVLLDFRAPGTLSAEILGPLMTPVARARVDGRGFEMDRLAVEGLGDVEVRAAAQGVLEAVAAVLQGEPFLPGPARLRAGWRRSVLLRPAWRATLGRSALAEAVAPAAGGAELTLTRFEKRGPRRVPSGFSVRGRLWELSLACPQPKVETDPLESFLDEP